LAESLTLSYTSCFDGIRCPDDRKKSKYQRKNAQKRECEFHGLVTTVGDDDDSRGCCLCRFKQAQIRALSAPARDSDILRPDIAAWRAVKALNIITPPLSFSPEEDQEEGNTRGWLS
jgi:hypothetical protein